MSENEKHYYHDMLSMSKVIYFSFWAILVISLFTLFSSCLSELGVISFAAGLDSVPYVMTVICLIGYSIFSILFAKRKISEFKNILSN